MSFLGLRMSRYFKGKACYNDTLVLGDWVLVENQFIFKINETRHFKAAERSFVEA